MEYEWRIIKATDYWEFEKSGSKQVQGVPFGANNAALADLVLAELTEGNGRFLFLDQIINGIWYLYN